MTKPVLADPRRSGTTSGLSFASAGGDGLEMPVLFQLADQSQFKVLTPPSRPKPEPKSAPKDLSAALPESTSATAASSPRPAAEPAEPTEASAASTPAESSRLTTPAVPAAADQSLLASISGATEPAAAPVPDSPTIRERAQLRQRRQAAAKGDWFQTQGKYIVVVFLVALVGTIYTACFRDDPAAPPAAGSHALDLAGDAAAPSTETPPTTVAPSEEPQLTAETDANPQSGDNPAATAAEPAADAGQSAVADTNPAVDLESPAASADHPLAASAAAEGSPQVNLQAPLANQEESPVAPSPDESLFPWASRQDERVASRPQPETAPSSVPMPRANPHYQPRQPTAGAAVSSPQTQPPAAGSQAPQLTAPGTAAEQPAAAVYPVTDPATYRSYQLEAPRWPAPSGAAPATYENRVPTAPRTSGPRYERTGSGLY